MKKWCRHIRWNDVINKWEYSNPYLTRPMEKHEKECPICGKPRPKEER